MTKETNKCIVKSSSFLKNSLDYYCTVIKNTSFLFCVLCAGLALSALIIYSLSNPFLFQIKLGLSASMYGIFALAIAFCEIVGSFINGFFVTRFGLHKMLCSGFILMLGMGFFMFFVGKYSQITLLSVLLPTMGIGISVGIILPNASAGALSIFSSSIGVVGAMYGFVQLLITTVSSFIISTLSIQTQLGIGCMIIMVSFFGLMSCKFLSDFKSLQATM